MTKPTVVPLASNPKARKCKWPGCKATLSITNPLEQCRYHRPDEDTKHYDSQKVIFAAVTLYGKSQEELFKPDRDPESVRRRKVILHILSMYCKLTDSLIAQKTGMDQSAILAAILSGQRNRANIAQDVRTILKMAS